MANLFKITYQGGGFAEIHPKYVTYMRYVPEQGRGTIYVNLLNGKEICVTGCTKEDALEYAKDLKKALDSDNSSIEVPDVPEIFVGGNK